MRRASVGLLIAAIVMPLPLVAQAAIGGIVGLVRTSMTRGAAETQADGLALGLSAGVALWRFRLDAGYLEARTESEVVGVERREPVEGWAWLGFEPTPGITLRVGPRVRAYVTAASTERWVLWEGRVRAERAILLDVVRGYVEVWRSFSGSVTPAESFSRLQGGEAGMVLRPFRAPLWAKLGYRMDQAHLALDRRETLELVMLSVGLGAR